MISFIVGLFVGAAIGVMIVALCVAAGRADQRDCEICPWEHTSRCEKCNKGK